MAITIAHKTPTDAPYYGIYIRTERRGMNWNLWRLHNVCAKISLDECIAKALASTYDKDKELNIQASQTCALPDKLEC